MGSVWVQTLAPKDGISITTLMTHRKLFARWMYLKLDLEGRDYMRHVQVLPLFCLETAEQNLYQHEQ